MSETILSRNISTEVTIPYAVVEALYFKKSKNQDRSPERVLPLIHRYAALGYNDHLFDKWVDITERSTLANLSSELKGYDKKTEMFHYTITISLLLTSKDVTNNKDAYNNFAKRMKAKIEELGLTYTTY